MTARPLSPMLPPLVCKTRRAGVLCGLIGVSRWNQQVARLVRRSHITYNHSLRPWRSTLVPLDKDTCGMLGAQAFKRHLWL